MVSLKATSRKYHGATAAGYRAKRQKQERWDRENQVVAEMLKGETGSVLDAPVGDGRFLPLYTTLNLRVLGLDISKDMLAQANARKAKGQLLDIWDIQNLDGLKKVDGVICVRFLDLVDEKAMANQLSQFNKVAKRFIIFTIRLGPKYLPKTNTATHDEKNLHALMRFMGWKLQQDVPIFNQGWHVFKFVRA